LKILDLRHSLDLIRTPDFSGLPALEKLILEDCICLVQIHESIGDLQRLLILNLRNCTSLMELPEEMSRLNSLQELVLDGCSNLDSLMNMELEHHQGRSLLQSDGIVASTSYITSLPLKLFFPSRFSAREMLRFTSFSLPRSLERIDLSGTSIRALPESIKDLGLLRELYLRNCKMLLALPELPSHLDLLDVSFCNSLQKLANLNRWTLADGCDNLVEFQDWIKQELIQRFDSHMVRIMKTVCAQIQPSRFEVLPHPFYCF
jgi:Leucine-rich repeat (LRR) protein